MARLRFRIAMSLDGYTAGPKQSVENPLGIGGNRLHAWAYPLAAWRAPQGLGGTVFSFVTNGIEAAYDQAKRAADGRDVRSPGEPMSLASISSQD